MVKKKKRDESKSLPKKAGLSFAIRMGVPTMDRLWNDLTQRFHSQELTGEEASFYKKWGKSLALLAHDPFYPSLKSHEILSLTAKYGRKVFESYLENNTPAAGRMFWSYGSKRGEIVILAIESHPERGEYGRVKLAEESD